MKRAVNTVAVVVSAGCPCGGLAVDESGSYMIGADSKLVICDVCGAVLTLPKRAAVFSA